MLINSNHLSNNSTRSLYFAHYLSKKLGHLECPLLISHYWNSLVILYALGQNARLDTVILQPSEEFIRRSCLVVTAVWSRKLLILHISLPVTQFTISWLLKTSVATWLVLLDDHKNQLSIHLAAVLSYIIFPSGITAKQAVLS